MWKSVRVPWWTAPALVFSMLLLVLWVNAGSLTPPPGPIGPSMKDLNTVEPRVPISSLPFTITSPGSYYVTKNLTGVANQHGIYIVTGNVTLDLNGYELRGAVNGSGGKLSLSGIAAAAPPTSTTCCVPGTGPGCSDSTCQSCVCGIDDYCCNVHWDATCAAEAFQPCGAECGCGQGQEVPAPAGSVQIRNGTLRDWGANGIHLQAGNDAGPVVIENVIVSNNAGYGVRTHSGTTISRCAAHSNGIDGFFLPPEGSGGVIVDSGAYNNSSMGFRVDHVTMARCTATGNGQYGIYATNSTISECVAHKNLIVGIDGHQSVVESSIASENSIGFSVHYSRISGCNASNNEVYGISADDGGAVEDNHCSGNNYGIRALGQFNAIDGNDLRANNVGLVVAGQNNVLTRNVTAGGNPYLFLNNVQHGALVKLVGNGVIPTDSPWANFYY